MSSESKETSPAEETSPVDVTSQMVEATSDGPPGGWYDDPHDAGQLRYWDGSTWTEYVHQQVPFAPPVPPPIAARQAAQPDGTVNDIGEWLRSSFRVALSNVIPGLVFVALGAVPFLIAMFLALQVLVSISSVVDEAVGDGLATTESFFTSNFDFLSAAGMVGALVVGIILGAVVQVGLAYLLHSAHVGQPVSLGQSLAVGLRRCWRLLGWTLVFNLVVALVIGVGVGFVGGASLIDPVLAVVVGVVLYVLALVAAIYYGVRLAFLPVACAVAPSGTGSLSAALEATKDRFFPVFGRLVLVSLLSYLVILPVQFAAFTFLPGLVNFDELEGADPEQLTPGDVIEPLLTVFGVIAVIYLLAIAIYQIFYLSALSRLYADLGGVDSRL